jgi:hypothetical protein
VRVHTAIRRRIVFVLLAAAVLVGLPHDAWAKQDWWGWLEEFSGPGPFRGFEFSAEFMCINLADRRVVAQAELEKIKAVKDSADAVVAAYEALEKLARAEAEVTPSLTAVLTPPLTAVRRQLAGVPQPQDETVSIDARLVLVGQQLGALEEKVPGRARELGVIRTAVTTLQAAVNTRQTEMANQVAQLTSAILLGIGAPDVKPRSTREFTVPAGKSRVRSCRGAQRAIEADRQADRDRSVQRIAAAGLRRLAPPEVIARDAAKDDSKVEIGDAEGGVGQTDIVYARRDWQTGLVVGLGRYRSLENVLFDATGTRPNEPQLQVVPFELVAHSKVSSAIDIGAGVGIAFLSTRYVNEAARQEYPGVDTKSTAFYLVPLSVVVRPGRLFTNSPLASVVGYRVSLRYFGNLTAENFGTPNHAYKANGEFVWGAAGFVDAVAAAEGLKWVAEKIRP